MGFDWVDARWGRGECSLATDTADNQRVTWGEVAKLEAEKAGKAGK